MTEKSKVLKHSLIFPTLFIIIIWLIKLYEYTLNVDLGFLGIYPRTLTGLKGIIFMPFIHGDFKHLFSNTFPVFILAVTLIYFYRGIGYRVILLIWFMDGLLTWAFARENYHIGASGLVYGFASFLFFSGTIRNNRNLLAISLSVAFMYGSIVWGIFPIDSKISWEGHLMGLISGIVLAFVYRHEGPQRKKYSWEIEEEEDGILNNEQQILDPNQIFVSDGDKLFEVTH